MLPLWEQVVQLWQRDHAKLTSFSINVQLYSLNHKIVSLSHLMGHQAALLESFNAKKLCSRDLQREHQFYSLNSEVAFLSHRLEDRRKEWDILSRWKARSRLPIGYNWTFLASSCGRGTTSEHTVRRIRPLLKGAILRLNIRLKGLPPTSIHH